MDVIEQLDAVNWNWTNGSNDPSVGFIAEDVAKLIPEIIGYDKDGQVMNLDYPKLTAVLTKGLQELNKKFNDFVSNAGSGLSSVATAVGEWVGEKVTATYGYFKNLTVGSSSQPAGITMYDRSTKEPYCLIIDDGEFVKEKGECSAVATATVATAGGLPSISINGNNPAEIVLNTPYIDLSAVITGPTEADKNLGIYTFVNGQAVTDVSLDTGTTTTYIIDYVATNSFGTATSTRIVTISNPNVTTEPISDTLTATTTPDTQIDTTTSTTSDETATTTPASE